MQRLSATEAISPAWDHTRKLLFSPRSFGLLVKIAFVAVFAQAGGFNFSSFRSSNPSSQLHHLPVFVHAALVAAALFLALVFLVIGLVLFYIGSRLQFVLFEVVLRRDTTIGPIWKRYGKATWRWIGLKLLYFLLAFLCAAPFLAPILIGFFRKASSGALNGMHFASILALFFTMFGAIFLVLLVIGIGYALLQDFGLPSMALEGTPMKVTVSRVFSLAASDPLQVVLFLVLRFIISIVWVIVGYILIFIGAAVSVIPFGIVGVLLWLPFRHAGLVPHIIMWGGLGILGLLYLAILILVTVVLYGCLYTFLQAYAIYFLGGRYPLLGEYLQPTPPPPPAPEQPWEPITETVPEPLSESAPEAAHEAAPLPEPPLPIEGEP